MPLGEKSLIARIREAAASAPNRLHDRAITAGIGDDSAILAIPPGLEILVTTDFFLEGIHFHRDWHSPHSAGHRCLARGLSDIAAMGGEPVASFLSLALPRDTLQSWVDRFVRGFLNLAEQCAAPLAGGDVAESPAGVVADVIVVGRVPAGQALRRSGAKPGQSIYVTGEVGGSAARLAALRRARPKVARWKRTAHPYFFPMPRLAVGRWLRENRVATAAIDISDGISTDLGHICEESRVGAVLYEAAVPRSRGATLEQALHGGDDYELLFTAAGGVRLPAAIADVQVTRIGEITPSRRRWIVDSSGKKRPLEALGWEHFTKQGSNRVAPRPVA